VADALEVSRFDPALFVLEFAQGTLTADGDTTRERLDRLRELGVRFAVDDFEPGESALDELQDFAIDIVKLDREFIATLSTSEEAASLVHRLMQLSESRHLQVIAAGIEDSDQRAALQNQRVPVGQGYLFPSHTKPKRLIATSKTSRFSPGSRCRPNDERSSVVRGP